MRNIIYGMTITLSVCVTKMAARQSLVSVMNVIVGLMVVTQVGAAYDPEASITGLYTGPYFDPLAPRNLTAHLGDRAELPCTVRQLGDKSVSWVRIRDADILTVDRYTFVGDERFEAQYSNPAETWNLIINYVQERDAGDYECQVSTEPKMSQFFNLRVVVPQVNIEPPGDRHVKSGSKVRIDCHITDVVQIPDYIFWYHDNVRVLDRTDENLDVTVTRTGEESIMSSLHIERVRKDQSGNYTCMPSNLHAAFTLLHVLNEEHPAAMQDGRNGSPSPHLSPALVAVLISFLLLAHFESTSCSYHQDIGDPNCTVKDSIGTNGDKTDLEHNESFKGEAKTISGGEVGVYGSTEAAAAPRKQIVALVKSLLEAAEDDRERITSLLVNTDLSDHRERDNVSCGLRCKSVPVRTQLSSSLSDSDDLFFSHPNNGTNKETKHEMIVNKATSIELQDMNRILNHIDASCSHLPVNNAPLLGTSTLTYPSPIEFTVPVITR